MHEKRRGQYGRALLVPRGRGVRLRWLTTQASPELRLLGTVARGPATLSVPDPVDPIILYDRRDGERGDRGHPTETERE